MFRITTSQSSKRNVFNCSRYPLEHEYSIVLQMFVISNSVEQSPLCETKSSTTNRECPRIVWKPKVHYRIHKISTPLSILSLDNSVHVYPFSVLEIYFNVILLFTSGVSKWYFLSGSSNKILYAFRISGEVRRYSDSLSTGQSGHLIP